MRLLTPGDYIKDYRVEQLVNIGAMATAYRARNKANEPVFMKVYLSPTIESSWYKEYVKYQAEITRRANSLELRDVVVGPIATFEAPLSKNPSASPFYIQVFEFISTGIDLERMLKDDKASWGRRTIWAKIIMGIIQQLHEQGIFHCGLKPANLLLFEAPEIKIGYSLKLIGIDFSVISDKRAPWHGHEGYVGSPGYYSPEHISGEVPGEKSDIFTCGLILYELLAGSHPYPGAFEGKNERLLAHECALPEFLDRLPEGNDEEVAAILHRMLDPNAANRPTAKEVLSALSGLSSRH